MRIAWVLWLTLLFTSTSWGQATDKDAARIESRFDGMVSTFINGKARKVRVVYRIWSIRPGARLDSLPVKLGGDTLFELHSGHLLTRGADGETERSAGEFWTVKRGEAYTMQTFDDTVVLRTVTRH